jgi:hypothetical protein
VSDAALGRDHLLASLAKAHCWAHREGLVTLVGERPFADGVDQYGSQRSRQAAACSHHALAGRKAGGLETRRKQPPKENSSARL